MSDSDDPVAFRTLRGFLRGHERPVSTYFDYCAVLRIHGDQLPFDEISHRLGVSPTNVHRKGERQSPKSPPHRDDAWHFQPDIPESEPLDRHIEALWNVVAPHIDYLKSLKERHRIDVFCGYRSNSDTAGFEVSHTCLKLFTALEVPFGVSVIVCPEEP
jgi:hypothetical protein